MTYATRERLAKVLGMTGSKHDAEALTALRMATELMARIGMSWEQLLVGGTEGNAIVDAFNDGYAQGASVEIPIAREKARHEGYEKGYAEGYAKGLLAGKNSPAARPRAWQPILAEMLGAHAHKLSDWETKFLNSLIYRKRLSPTPRQRDVLERIAHKCGVQVPPEEGGSPPW